MAHDLATTNGRTAMAYFGEVPWHRLGTSLEEPATAEEAIEAARAVGAELTYLTHMTHEVRHQALLDELPSGVQPAYDGLTVEI